MLNREES
jgi:aryl-alcohol dehydrogenase-like predicted oxidoreductase